MEQFQFIFRGNVYNSNQRRFLVNRGVNWVHITRIKNKREPKEPLSFNVTEHYQGHRDDKKAPVKFDFRLCFIKELWAYLVILHNFLNFFHYGLRLNSEIWFTFLSFQALPRFGCILNYCHWKANIKPLKNFVFVIESPLNQRNTDSHYCRNFSRTTQQFIKIWCNL